MTSNGDQIIPSLVAGDVDLLHWHCFHLQAIWAPCSQLVLRYSYDQVRARTSSTRIRPIAVVGWKKFQLIIGGSSFEGHQMLLVSTTALVIFAVSIYRSVLVRRPICGRSSKNPCRESWNKSTWIFAVKDDLFSTATRRTATAPALCSSKLSETPSIIGSVEKYTGFRPRECPWRSF